MDFQNGHKNHLLLDDCTVLELSEYPRKGGIGGCMKYEAAGWEELAPTSPRVWLGKF